MSAMDVRVGDMRPSQLMWSYGVGAMIDLPRLSVMVDGIDRWNLDDARSVSEDRLLAAVRRVLGPQVAQLCEPPLPEEEPFGRAPTDAAYRVGVPVSLFPRWLRCPRCKLLNRAQSGVFERKGHSASPDDIRYVHTGCIGSDPDKPKRAKRDPSAVPARFVTACREGHVDDFPWREFVHRGPTSCTGFLRFHEVGSSLETSNLFVTCDEGVGFGSTDSDGNKTPAIPVAGGCGAKPRSMVDAFGPAAQDSLPVCRGHHPHLRHADGECQRELKTILLGSSSSWFPRAISALSIPTGATELDGAVEDLWSLVGHADSADDIRAYRKANLLRSATKFSDDEIYEVVAARRDGVTGAVETEDMKVPEWDVLRNPASAPSGDDFLVTLGDVPAGHDGIFEPTVLVEKIREVNALIGFTRLEAPEELLRGEDVENAAPLSIDPPTWVPANEVRGEGILVRFRPDAIRSWEERPAVAEHLRQLEVANDEWRVARQLEPGDGYPGHRHVLIHTFSHLLMRELALECGYSASSIRERIYASAPDDMAGVLLYTAAPDSEGTLGGLVRLGEARFLGRLITQALEHAALCAADPLCAEHDPVPDRVLHAAACHACSFAPETGCEHGNRFLDRATVVPTLTQPDAALFAPS